MIPTLRELEETLDAAAGITEPDFLATSLSEDLQAVTKMSLSRLFVEYGFFPKYEEMNKGDFITEMKQFDLTIATKAASIG